MDSNGQRFWLALGGAPWSPDLPGTLETLPRVLRLASQTSAPAYPEKPDAAEASLALVPLARDAYGTRAFLDPDTRAIRATGAFSEPEAVPASPVLVVSPEPVTDLVLGADGHLHYATASALRLHPLNDRYAPQVYSAPVFSPWRLAAAPDGTLWALDRVRRRLARLVGTLWPEAPDFREPPAEAFIPAEPNPDPRRLEVIPDGWLSEGEDPVALAISPEGRLAVLVWTPTAARLRLVDDSGRPGPAATLGGLKRPYSLVWLSAERFAVLAAEVPEAVAYTWREGTLVPSGEILPLRAHDGGPFLHHFASPAEYLSRQPTATLPRHLAPRPLVAISQLSLARAASATLASPLDSGQAGTAWHRLYVDARLPAGTGFTLLIAASDTADTPEKVPDPADWHPHHFGSAPPAADRNEPTAAWVRRESEIPGQPSLTEAAIEPHHTGLFTVLIQRANRPVRTLTGRFLHLKIAFRGHLHATPCLHAVRAYGPRFSYQDKYLPALYRETLFSPEADTVGAGQASTRPDFLGRFLANFEGVLTPLEDDIAASWLLTDPSRTPAASLDWLGSWIGVAFAPWFPAAQRRLHLQKAPELHRQRGTLRGLRLALDIATAGGVRHGRLVVLEDFWFRRTLQTLLGVSLDKEHDELLGGPVVSGNSKVGRTLFLGEEHRFFQNDVTRKKFLALFDAELELSARDQAVVDDLFASLAHRVTIVVHEQSAADELQLIERVAALQTPAHLIVRVRPADRDFIVGLSALLGADTFLRPHPPAESVEIGETVLGDGSLLSRPQALDPRLTGPA
jgi:phage tail-like protein